MVRWIVFLRLMVMKHQCKCVPVCVSHVYYLRKIMSWFDRGEERTDCDASERCKASWRVVTVRPDVRTWRYWYIEWSPKLASKPVEGAGHCTCRTCVGTHNWNYAGKKTSEIRYPWLYCTWYSTPVLTVLCSVGGYSVRSTKYTSLLLIQSEEE
jgi:hypothetical protein